MKDYIERMQKERDELCSRVNRLEKAIITFELTSPKRYELMQSQLKSMKDYLFYLEERIHYELNVSEINDMQDKMEEVE